MTEDYALPSGDVATLVHLLICLSEGFEVRAGHRWCTHRVQQVDFAELAGIYRSLRDAYCSRMNEDQRDEQVIATFNHYILICRRAGHYRIEDCNVDPEMISRATERNWSVLFEAAAQSAINQTKLGTNFEAILHAAQTTLHVN